LKQVRFRLDDREGVVRLSDGRTDRLVVDDLADVFTKGLVSLWDALQETERRSSLKTQLRVGITLPTALILTALLPLAGAQAPASTAPDATGRENAPFSRNEAELPKGPAPRLGEHPDLSGYWLP